MRHRYSSTHFAHLVAFAVGSLCTGLMAPALAVPTEAAVPPTTESSKQDSGEQASQLEAMRSVAAVAAAAKEQASEKPKYPPYSVVLKELKEKDGGLKLHHSTSRIFAELKPTDLNQDFFILLTIARGIGQQPIYGGFSWNFGDDWVWQFRRVGENIHVVRRNVRFTAKPGTPEARAVQLAYTDSVLFSLPIATQGPGGTLVVDLTPVFMSDLPQISQMLPGFVFAPTKSSLAAVEAYPKNVEVQVAATYASSGKTEIETVPDSRGVTINVHYSISRLPKTSYKPRLADDRIGYFLTVVKDFSKQEDNDRFVRYINRWNLEKSDPEAEKSTPKEPITFYLEKTIPFKYRKPIRDGIEEWNKAFEEAGFYNAIEVLQQPDDATWEPGDVRYNTFRWITSSAGFAMGPSRVNPSTGEILDADIIFDSDFLQSWKQKYETFTPEGIAALTGGPVDIASYKAEMARRPAYLHDAHHSLCACNLLSGMSQQFAFGATVASARKRSPKELDRLIMQGLKEVAMHEVGHTLGLRHNFKASTLYSIKDLNDVEKTSKTGLAASVMDYTPVNIAPKGVEQGDYYSTTIGPYDYWAIEYGYKPLKASSPEAEVPELRKIASRSGERELAYATDEDTRGIDPDPHSNRFDFSNNLVEWAEQQAQLVAEAMPSVVDDMVEEGHDYSRARQAFGVLLSTHGQAMFAASRYIGGLHIARSHKGDKDAQPPFQVISAEKQRQALKLIGEQMFSDKPFSYDPNFYNLLAPSHWRHWGAQSPLRADLPAHEVILMWQERILDRVMSSLTLARLHDSEMKVDSSKEAFTTVDLLEGLTHTIFSEVDEGFDRDDYTPRKPAISSMRRNLQRAYLKRMSNLALGRTDAPQDCQTVAYSELADLKKRIDEALEDSADQLDRYSRSHLQESTARIEKVLDARFTGTP